MKVFGLFVLFLVFLSNFKLIISDLPVHCTSFSLFGNWKFYIESETFSPDLKNLKTSCGHGFPNKVIHEKKDYSFKEFTTMNLKLNKDFTVDLDNEKSGTFTSVYDEGIIINLDGKIITVHMYYYPKDNADFESDCSKTHIGWINKGNNNWSCVFGQKIEEYKFLQMESKSNSSSSSFMKSKLSMKEKMWSEKYDSEMAQNLVETINNDINSTWKAAIHPNFKGMSLLQVREKLVKNKKMSDKVNKNIPFLINDSNTDENYISFIQMNNKNKGKNNVDKKTQNIEGNTGKIKLINNPNRDKDSEFVTSYEEVMKYSNKSLDEIDINQIPKNWNWGNVGGKSYLSQVRNQGDCGSCYVVSTIGALESRLRIKTDNKDQTKFSIQFPLSCGLYTEGCEGGYPILVGKFFNEFEILPEDCFDKYQEITGVCNINKKCNHNKKYIVSKYGYINGAYGKSTEEDMIKELRARGPILGNIKMDDSSFYYYSSGIFSSSNKLEKNSDYISVKSIIDNNKDWEKVDHSTLIVGYGEEKGIKYWILMNSWGEEWGEKGLYKLLRGEDELNIESMCDFLDIKIQDR